MWVPLFLGIQGPCGRSTSETPCMSVSSCSRGAGCDRSVRRDDNPFTALMQGDSLQAGPNQCSMSTCRASFKDGSNIDFLVCACVCVCLTVHIALCVHAFRIAVWNSLRLHSCVPVQTCMCLRVCVRWRWPIQERGGGGRAPIYIGSHTRGNELTSKRACSWIVKRARESSTHELADRLSKHRQTFPGLARRLHSHICSAALVTVRCSESECELCITPVKHCKMYSAPFVRGSSRRCWELHCCLLLPAVRRI